MSFSEELNKYNVVLLKQTSSINASEAVKLWCIKNGWTKQQILYADTRDDNNKVFYIGDYAPTNIEEWGNEIAEQLGTRIIKMPYFLIKLTAFLGDALKVVGVNFPMTSFRLKNMTTDNIIDLSNTKMIAPNLPYTRKEGVRATLKWMMQA